MYSVIALSKLYDLQDPRLDQVQVKGDLIVPDDTSRIMTRSRARQNPDQFTIVPATLKILKVLVEELLSASGVARAIDAATSTTDLLEDEGSDNGEWEDDDGIVDLGLGATRAELMAYAEEGVGSRQRDDETQAYLVNFFREASQKPGFNEMFAQLTEEEREKLRMMS